MSNLWAASIIACKPEMTHHTVAIIEATSKFEANGKALAIAEKCYQTVKGWSGHHVVSCSVDQIVNPDMDFSIPGV